MRNALPDAYVWGPIGYVWKEKLIMGIVLRQNITLENRRTKLSQVQVKRGRYFEITSSFCHTH